MRPFERDLEQITVALLRLAALVEEQIGQALRSLCARRPELADGVIRGDAIVDQLEVRIEEDCLHFLVRHDPLARDLRRIATVLKVNHELERMADEAVSIARRARALGGLPPDIPVPHDLSTMAEVVVTMVRDGIEAFIDADVAQARAVIARDDDVDRIHRQVIGALEGIIRVRPHAVAEGLHLFSAAGHLERIADHATNVSEEVVYLAEGEIIRHRRGEASESRLHARAARGRAPACHGLHKNRR